MAYDSRQVELGVLMLLYKLYGTYNAGKTWGIMEYDKGKKWRKRIEEILREENVENG